MPQKTFEKIEFGDFQTPPILARQVVELLQKLGLEPHSILEPHCGQGNLLLAALTGFPEVEQAIGADISPLYIESAQSKRDALSHKATTTFIQADFFQTEWPTIIGALPEPLLVIGNPPWVTNTQVAALGGSNVPTKSNFQNHQGLEAKMGKSNFDISEWMLIQCLQWLQGRRATMAVLCKTTVARKLLAHAYKNNLNLSQSRIYPIEALKHFGAAVDACLFVCHFDSQTSQYDCQVYRSLSDFCPERVIGYRDGHLVSKVALYEKWRHLQGEGCYQWRSGIKHDCSKVMELAKEGDKYRNGLGELVELEAEFLYPMLKTSEVANASTTPTRFMLVTQRTTGEATAPIRHLAPLTWAYLELYGHRLDQRGSIIYKNRPRFAVFGVGDYAFAPWKVAISGFYKRLQFKVVGPAEGKSVVLDDSSYFLACQSQTEALLVAKLLNSPPAQEFFDSLVFWDSKRPVTVDLLRKIDLRRVACELGLEPELQRFLSTEGALPERRRTNATAANLELPLF